MNICILAAGAGGMYCGSCMRDNALARALIRLGHQATLVPMYTPLRTDAEDVSVDQVFYGGVNVYLQYASGLFRHTPRIVDWLFDRRWLLEMAGKHGSQTSPAKLGPFILSVLRGDEGPQVKELNRLAAYIRDEIKPDILSLPTIMFLGMARALRRELSVPIICELTGEDIFLDAMVEPYRAEAGQIIRAKAGDVDAFVATSRYYAGRMTEYLGVPAEKIDVVYPGVPPEVIAELGTAQSQIANRESRIPPIPQSAIRNPQSLAVGFLARVCPEKGLDRLIDAMLLLRKLPGMGEARLKVAGYLGKAHQDWFAQQWKRVDASWAEHLGEVTLMGKLALLDSIDVLCVPTAYAEPKGIFVLEALARGVPAVVPNHGSFPELIEQTGGGVLAPVGDPAALAAILAELLRDPARRAALGASGREAVGRGFRDEDMARGMLAVYSRTLSTNG